jgi:hypothetical protein
MTFKNTPSSYELLQGEEEEGLSAAARCSTGIIICMVQSQGWMDLMNMSLNLI